MTCQTSTSGSSSLAAENIRQVSNIIEDGMNEYKSNVSTKEQQILLLTEINEHLKCKTCAADYVKCLAYEIAREVKDPKSWMNKNQKIKSEWLRKFEDKYKDKIPKFPCDCKNILSHNNTSTSKEVFQTILPSADEQLFLTQRQKIETQHDRYKNPLTTEEINLSYKVKSKWQKKFEESHKDDISKLLYDRKEKLSQNQASTSKAEEQFQTILHTDDEQSLLIQPQETETRHNKYVRPLIAEELNLSHEVKRCYSESSNSNKQAEHELFNFEERHKDQILKFPLDCKIESSQTSKSGGQKFHFRVQTILTTDDEQLLLTQLQKVKTRHSCKCKSCIMKEVSILAYKIACQYKRRYPETWNRDKQAGQKWVKLFVARHKNEISKFSSVCKNEMSTNKTNYDISTILTKEDEQLLLTQLQEMETQHSCKCKNCIIKEIPILAYKIAHKYKRCYPETWNRNKQAGGTWVRLFVIKYKDEISKFSSVCENETSTNKANAGKPKILTKEDEQLLLTQLQEMETHHGCKCKSCIKKEVPILAYKMARKYERSYPETWDRDKQAGQTWVYFFVARNKDEISKFSSVCENETSTNKANAGKPKILTKEDEQLLLTQLQEMETQHGCKCKNCIIKEVPILAYKIAHKYKRCYPETWNRNKQAGKTWVRLFVIKYKDEIFKFSSVCENETSTNKANAGKPKILTKEDEQLLLTQLQEMETQHGCKCKSCIKKEIPILAYKIARKYERSYLETWDRDKQAGQTWVRRFVARYTDEISKFSSVCKKNFK